MAYNVPTNGIEADFLYINAGVQSVIYNSVTYTTGQTFKGIIGITSFAYSGSGTQIVNEVENVSGAAVEMGILSSDANFTDVVTKVSGAEVELLLSINDLIFPEKELVNGAAIELNYNSQPSVSIRKRISGINKVTVYTAPPRIAYFGDSWTWAPGGYPSIVNTINGISYTNYGVSGTTVYAGSGNTSGVPGSNLSDKYMTEIGVGYSGQYTSFMYGTNDVGILDATWKSTYKGIIQAFITAGWPPNKLIIMIPGKQLQPLDLRITNYISQIANELGINLYDVNQRFLETGRNYDLCGSDQHPNADGNNVIATGYDTFIKR